MKSICTIFALGSLLTILPAFPEELKFPIIDDHVPKFPGSKFQMRPMRIESQSEHHKPPEGLKMSETNHIIFAFDKDIPEATSEKKENAN